MFCPNCRTEYRSGFGSCFDCGASLVHKLPSPAPNVETPRLQFPGVVRPSHFLAWFVPMTITVALFAGVSSGSAFFRNTFIVVCTCLLVSAHNIGAFWMILPINTLREERPKVCDSCFRSIYVCLVCARRVRSAVTQGNSESIRH